MGTVKRVYVEKKSEFAVQAKELYQEDHQRHLRDRAVPVLQEA